MLCSFPSAPPETPLTHLGPLIWGFALRSRTKPRPGASPKCWCSDSRECLCCPGSPHLEPPFLLWSLVSGKSHKADLWIEILLRQITMLLLPSVLWNSILCPRLMQRADSVTVCKKSINLSNVPHAPFWVLITSQNLWEMVKELFIKAHAPYYSSHFYDILCMNF